MKLDGRNAFRRTTCLLMLAATAAAPRVKSAEWLGITSDWDLPDNWSTGLVPHRNEPVLFSNMGATNPSLNGDSYASELSFFSSFSVSGGTLNLNSGFISVVDASFAQIASTLAGSFGLTKVGNGQLNLTGSIAYSGFTSVTAGTLEVSALPTGASLGISQGATVLTNAATLSGLSGNGLISAGYLEISNNFSQTFEGFIGAGTLKKTGAGEFTYRPQITSAAPAPLLGAVQVMQGVLSIHDYSFTGFSTLSVGSTHVASNAVLNVANVALGTLSGAGSLNIQDHVYISAGTFSGSVAGDGTLVVSSSGLTLSGAAGTGTINLRVEESALSLNHDNALPNQTAVACESGTVQLNGYRQQFTQVSGNGYIALGSGTLELGGGTTVAGPANVAITGPGSLKVSSGFHEFTQPIGNLDHLEVAGDLSVAGLTTNRLVIRGGVLRDTSIQNLTVPSLEGQGGISAPGGFTISGNRSTTFRGTIHAGSGGFELAGGGTLSLIDATITHDRTTTISGSTLKLQNSSIPPNRPLELNGGTFDMNGNNVSCSSLDGTGTINLGSINAPGQLMLAGTNESGHFQGTIKGHGNVQMFGGSVTLAGSHSFTGEFNMSDGTLRFEGGQTSFPNAFLFAGGPMEVNDPLTVSGFSTSGTLTVNDDLVVDHSGAYSNSIINGPLLGGGTIVKTGSGELRIEGNVGSFSGNLDARNGTLYISNTGVGSLASASMNAGENGTIIIGHDMELRDLTGTGTVEAQSLRVGLSGFPIDFGGVLIGNGSLELQSDTTFRKPQRYEGSIYVQTQLFLRDEGRLDPRAAVVNTGNLDLGPLAQQVGSIEGNGPVIAGGTLSVGGNNNSTEMYGPIIAAKQFIKEGTGTFRLLGGFNGSHTFGGGIWVRDGTLSLECPSDINGPIVVRGTGTAKPVLQIDDDDRLGAPSLPVLLAGGTLRAANNFTTQRPIVLGDGANGSGTISVTQSKTFTIDSPITGLTGLTKAGPGTLALSASNNYSGSTRVREGTLLLSGSGAIPAQSVFTVDLGGALDLGEVNRHLGSLAGAGTVALGSSSLIFGSNGAFTTYSGTIEGNGGIVKTGEGQTILSGNNTFQGGLTLNSGTLVIEGGQIFSGGVTINGGLLRFAQNQSLGDSQQPIQLAGGTLQCAGGSFLFQSIAMTGPSAAIDVTGGNSLNVPAITGGGILRKSGAGRLENGSVLDFSGILKLEPDGGTVLLRGDALSSVSQIQISRGSLLNIEGSDNDPLLNALNDSATITFNGGTLALSVVAPNLNYEVAGPLVLASSHSVIRVESSQPGGAGSISFASLTRPITGGASLDILGVNMGTDSRVLVQTGVNNAALPTWLKVNGVAAKYDVNAGYVERSFPLPGPVPGMLWGDANLDGFVDTYDYSVVMQNFNAPIPSWSEGDFNEDGFVTQGDLNLLMGNLPANAVVPEPCSLSAMICALFARRRRSR